jgi:hypothetical protein
MIRTRRQLRLAFTEQAASAGPVDNAKTFATDLDLASLHLALCWLGGAPGWVPPVEHRQDWFREAISLAHRIERRAA